MTPRKFLLTTSLLVALGLLSLSILVRGDFVIPSNFIFRSAEELLALRNLLDDEKIWAELLSLSERMAIWKIGSSSEPAPPGEDCLPLTTGLETGERVRHWFGFASRTGISSRVYRLEYISCKKGEGRYDVERVRSGFLSEYHRNDEALLSGTIPLKVLRLAIRDPGVSRDIVDALRQESITYCRVSREGEGPRPGVTFYRFLAFGDPDHTVVEYLVEYDADRDSAIFSRV